MWENYWGREVPAGCAIHHLDWDKSHNTIENLICVTSWEHNMIHNPPSVVVMNGVGGKEWGYKLIENRVEGLPASVFKKIKDKDRKDRKDRKDK